MRPRRCLGFALLWLGFGLTLSAQIQLGDRIPDFSLTSGGGKVLRPTDLTGKYLILFYETKEKKDQNRLIKEQLNDLYTGLSPSHKSIIERIPVVDCSRAFWPFTGIWQGEMERIAKNEHFEIWGDWDGSFRQAFGFTRDETYLLFIDTSGIVRFFQKGPLNNERRQAAIDLFLAIGN